MKRTLAGCLALAIFLMAATFCHDRNLDALPQKDDYLGYLVIPSMTQLRLMSLGYEDLTADALYIFLIQNYTIIPKSQRAQHTFDLADRAGQLKGENRAPYVMSFIFLANLLEERDLAYELADLAIERMPNDVQVPFVALTEAALLEKNNPRARKYAQIILDRDPTNYFAERMLARSLVHAGNLKESLGMWKNILREADEGKRPNGDFYAMLAEKNIHDLTIRIQCKALTEFALEYQQVSGQSLKNFEQLLEQGVWKFIPRDPKGNPYQWDSENQEAVSATAYKFKAASSW